MSTEVSLSTATSVFRIDRFSVPTDARSSFMERLRLIQQLLSALPGCQQNLVLTQAGDGGEFNVITLVEWASAEAMAAAKTVAQKKYAEEGFNPASFMQRLGVRADFGVYSAAS